MRRAIFLDRDGVLIEDVNLLTDKSQIRVLDGVGSCLSRMRNFGFLLICVSNQTVLARGLMNEIQFDALQSEIVHQLDLSGAPNLDRFYYCFHHPEAQVQMYRGQCECRKPRPGLIRKAAFDFNLDLRGCFMLGDRITDVEAGHTAGCRTALIASRMTDSPRIATDVPIPVGLLPDYSCNNLVQATEWILGEM
jgi:D-glycero-D-manno-heptose 1,7-bisphosphate phosphatase